MSDAATQASTPRLPGLSVRSLSAMALGLLLSAMVVAISGVFDSANNLIGNEALPVPALLVAIPLLFVCSWVGVLARLRLLTRAELLCVSFALLIGTPLMSMGFWRYQLAGTSTIVRGGDWLKFEALPDKLWPHGDNLLAGALSRADACTLRTEAGGNAQLRAGHAAFGNPALNATAALRCQLLLGERPRAFGDAGRAVAVPGRPYLLTALVKAEALAADSTYFVRLYADDEPAFAAEPISGRQEAKATPLLPDGFVRVGFYPLTLPAKAKHHVALEVGLRGSGKASFRDLRLYDVRAIESAYKGFSRVTRDEFAALSLSERQDTLLVPDAWFSGAGLRYLLGLSYPIADWLTPVFAYATFALLVFSATMGLGLLYRRQWLENERFPLPMARFMLVLLGADEADGGLGARFWRSSWLWIGFGLSFLWCALKVLYGYFPSLPDVRINVAVKSYLADASWGHTWDGTDFSVMALFLGLGLFMELNVLLSLVLGFIGFRMQYWLGQAQGLNADQDFPYFDMQMSGAYLVYAALLVFATRRHLVESVRSALQRGPASREVWGQRAGIALFVFALLGFACWGLWLGLPLHSVALLSGHVVLVAFITQKFRAECGLPFAGFTHPLGSNGSYNATLEAMLLVPLLGGMAVFGGASLITMSLVCAIVLPFGFFVVPGLQVELLELGRRFQVRTSHLVATVFIGVIGAIVIGGWVYLTSLYGFGATRFAGVSDFGDRMGAFRVFNAEYASAQSAIAAAASGAPAPNSGLGLGKLLALGFGAFGAGLVTVLRQLFPGFWFHPVGFLLGPSHMMQNLWGSLLVAYLIRLAVLRLGGAATVREKLMPAAAGIVLGALAAHALYIVGNAYYFFFSKGNVKFSGFL
ncbi:MAG: hypothetical protein QM756_19615 [Polyangiaceae bacterium]